MGMCIHDELVTLDSCHPCTADFGLEPPPGLTVSWNDVMIEENRFGGVS